MTHSTSPPSVPGFVVGAALGRGASATVYEARRELGPQVAIKVLSAGRGARQPLGRERFLREARAAARLNHPHVVRVLEHGISEEGMPYLVMERVDGGTLAEALAQGPMPVDRALILAGQIAAGLAHAHAHGVVHRDVKPANVLISKPPAPAHARLADFGLARDRDDLPLTATGALCGTPAYMAPELVDGVPPSPASDLYALGCLLFELLTGRPPFLGSIPLVLHAHAYDTPSAPSSLREDLSPAIDALTLELLAKKPGHRPPDAAGVEARILRMLNGLARDPRVEAWSACVRAAHGAVALAFGSAPPARVVARLDALARRVGELERVTQRGSAGSAAPGEQEKLAQLALEVTRLRAALAGAPEAIALLEDAVPR